MRYRATPARRSGGALATGVFTLLALAGLGAIAAPPIAASAVELSPVTSITIETETPNDPLLLWQRYAVNVEWSVPDSAVAGDTFSVAFPSPVVAFAANFELKDAKGTVIGSCEVSEKEFVCTFNSYVDTHNSVSGSLYFYAQSNETTDEGTYTFVAGNGMTIPVTIPGGGVIEGEAGPAPTEPVKYGWVNSDGKSITWRVLVPSENLAPIGGRDVVMTDVYDAKLGFEPGSLQATWTLKSNWPELDYNVISAGTGPDTFTLVDSPATHSFDLSFNEANSDGTRLYIFEYRTTLPANVSHGDFFENHITAGGKEFTTWPVEYVSAGGEGGGIADQGAFTVTKSVTGDGASLITSEARFTVAYSYVQAGGTVAGTLSIANGKSDGLSGLATGTVVTLSELAPAAIDGAIFGTPVFGGDGVSASSEGATLTIGDRTTVAVTLENPLSLVPPVIPPVDPHVDPPTPAVPGADKPTASALASTGPELAAGMIGVGILLLSGLGLMYGSRRRARG